MADIGYGVKVALKAAGSDDFTELAEVMSITPPTLTTDEVETTHMASAGGFREYIPGLVEAGSVEMELNHTENSATDILISALVAGRSPSGVKITYPNDRALTADCFVAEYSKTTPIDDRQTATLRLRLTGQITLGAA